MAEKYAKRELLTLRSSMTQRLAVVAAQTPDLISLATGDPDFDTPRHIKEAAYGSMMAGYTHYQFSVTQELAEAIASYYGKYGVRVDPKSEVAVYAGSGMAIFSALSAILNPRDEVLIFDPTYPSYSAIASYLGAKIVHVPFLKERSLHDAFRPAIETLRRSITPNTKALVICNPDNPTGCLFSDTELSEIAELAKERDFLVISDEIYNEFIWGPGNFTTISKIPGMHDRTIIIMSFSKTFAMTGWRIGYAISSPALISLMRGIPTGAGPCDFMQKAAATALSGPFDEVYKMKSEYEKRIDYCIKRLKEIPGIFCSKPQGAFYLFPDISGLGKPSIDFCEVLAREGKVMLAPGIGFGPSGEGYVRIALVRPIPVLDQCMDAIEKVAKSLCVS